MDFITMLFALFTWFALAMLASMNGWLRNKLYKKALGELTAHQISSIIFIGIIFFVSYFFVKWTGTRNSTDLWIIGAIWFALTICFEFVFGHYVFKHPWHKLLEDYNIMKGRLWILILVATLIAPYIVSMM